LSDIISEWFGALFVWLFALEKKPVAVKEEPTGSRIVSWTGQLDKHLCRSSLMRPATWGWIIS